MLFKLVLLLSSVIKLTETRNSLLAHKSSKEIWKNDLKRHLIDLLHQHHSNNDFQQNDIGFLQFGNDTSDFVGEFLAEYGDQITDRAIVITKRPLIRSNVIVSKSHIMVVIMGQFDQTNLQKFIKKMTTSIFWHVSSPILLLPIFSITFKTNVWLEYLFNMLNHEYLFNIGIIYHSQQYNKIERVSYNPFASDPLEFHTNYLFYNKVLNLNGYELKVAHFQQMNRFEVSSNGTIRGVDGIIFLIVCRHLNATYKIISADDALLENIHSKINELILTRRADLSFNFLIYFNRNYLTALIIPIYPFELETIVLLIPAARLVSPYRHFIDPFSPVLWIAILFMFYLSGGILYWVNRKLLDSNGWNWMELVQIHLSHPLPQSIRNKPKRAIYSFLAIYTFILFHSYQTKLTSFLMSSRHDGNYQSVSEVNNSQLQLITAGKTEKLVKIFLENQPMLNTQIQSNLSIWQVKKKLEEQNKVNFELGCAFFVRKEEAIVFETSYLNEFKGEKILEIIDDSVLSSTISYALLRGSPLEVVINNIVGRMREGGMYTYHHGMNLHKTAIKKRQYNLAANTVRKDSLLSFDEFKPVFQMFLAGMNLSLCFFILELSFDWIRNTARRLKTQLIQMDLLSKLKKLWNKLFTRN